MNLTAGSLRDLVHQVLNEAKMANDLPPPMGISLDEPETEAPTEKASSDVDLVLTHMRKINTPQEQMQILGPLLDMLLGKGEAEDQLSREQRTQSLRKALEDKYGTESGPLISALRNLIVKI
jgi:hypothetical protein